MKRLGTWLAILAIALQAAWPLIAAAKPASVALVPLCTVDGVTHYLEVPTGKSPAEGSPAHAGHCAYCFFGERLSLPAGLPCFVLPAVAAPAFVEAAAATVAKASPQPYGARAPPASFVRSF